MPRTGGADGSRPADGLRRRPDRGDPAARHCIGNPLPSPDCNSDPIRGRDGDACGDRTHRSRTRSSDNLGHRDGIRDCRGVPHARERRAAVPCAHGRGRGGARRAGSTALDARRPERGGGGRGSDRALRRRGRPRARVHGPVRHADGARVGAGRPGAGGDERPLQSRVVRLPRCGRDGAAAGNAVSRNHRGSRPRSAGAPQAAPARRARSGAREPAPGRRHRRRRRGCGERPPACVARPGGAVPDRAPRLGRGRRER